MINEYKFVNTKKACDILGVSSETLRRMDSKNQITTIRTGGKQRLYNIEEYINNNISVQNNTLNKISVCYCRVSTSGQKGDLER